MADHQMTPRVRCGAFLFARPIVFTRYYHGLAFLKKKKKFDLIRDSFGNRPYQKTYTDETANYDFKNKNDTLKPQFFPVVNAYVDVTFGNSFLRVLTARRISIHLCRLRLLIV